MPYATQQDLVDRYGERELLELTDKGNLGTVDDTAVTRALDDAADLIEAALAGRYVLPLNSVPRLLTSLACTIARHNLFAEGPPEHVRKAFEDARKTLADIAAGRAVLQVEGIAPAAAGGGAVLVDAPERRFSDDTLGDYMGQH